MTDLENRLRETLHRHASGLPTDVTAAPPLVAAVRRRRATTSALLCAMTAAAVLGIVLGVRLTTPDAPGPVEPPPTPRQTTALVYVGTNGGIWSRAEDGSTSAWLGDARMMDICGVPCFPNDLAWSPDGRTLAVLMGPACCLESTAVNVVVMSSGGQDARRLFVCPEGTGCADGMPQGLAWSPDSRQIAVATSQEMYLVPLDGGPPELVCTCAAFHPAFLPDGRLAYVAAHRLQARDLETGATTTLLPDDRVQDGAWSPDGRYAVVLTGSNDNFLSVLDFSASPPVRPEPQRAGGIGARWSPSGDRFVYLSDDGAPMRERRSELWIGIPGRPPQLLHRFPHAGGGWAQPVWSPDGSMVELFLGSGMQPGGTIWVIDANSGTVVDTITGAQGGAAWQRAPGADQ